MTTIGEPSFSPEAFSGVLHQYSARQVAFEFVKKDTEAQQATNLVLFISGLTEGLLCPSYPKSIAASLPKSWTLAQVLLSSSYSGWGTSSLVKDAREIAACVKYFRTIRSGKIVLLGHSTGCQDIMEYLVGSEARDRPQIEGAIMQAGASDREAMVMLMTDGVYEKSVEVARKMIAEGKGEDIMPTDSTQGFLGEPCCARRWLSLASPDKDGDDDFFSSDLEDQQLKDTFGKIPMGFPLAVFFSGEDEYVPASVDKKAMVNRWLSFAEAGGAGVNQEYFCVIEGASHNLMGNPDEILQRLLDKVLGYLSSL